MSEDNSGINFFLISIWDFGLKFDVIIRLKIHVGWGEFKSPKWWSKLICDGFYILYEYFKAPKKRLQATFKTYILNPTKKKIEIREVNRIE